MGSSASDLDAALSTFASLAATAVTREDGFLRDCLDAYTRQHGYYKSWPHGIASLYEQALVYVILQELLSSRFPYEVGWEQPYPGHPTHRADLFINAGNEPLACIECKIWFSEDGAEIRRDLEKMASLPAGVRRCVLLLFWNETTEQIDENVGWLRNTLGLTAVSPSPCKFRTKVLHKGEPRDAIAAIGLLEHMG
ncbi:hypothetical protein [Geochorda subterranea]|uniref:PD-(D/E)XK nuclease superfamily protein n=1 Tax=Geochorda subterranea TaxID=3109564 RepID=A0ABZ1BLY2_9FIRM|nr:hypothetical protein [Limnochorda sp. LNt]WRP13772.1 hypothetical protein VLY81_10020 [Limnochorda sp. LNt]